MITLDKKYRYRNGDPARVLCVDANDDKWPIISLNDRGNVVYHTAEGIATQGDSTTDIDLIEVREPARIWCNRYDKTDNWSKEPYKTQIEAAVAAHSSATRAAVPFIELTEEVTAALKAAGIVTE